MIFNQFIEPPGPALARLRAVKRRGSMAACSATVASAEREGAVAGHLLRSRRRSGLSRVGRGLTLRSRRGPTAGHQARAGGTRYIFTSPGLASHRCSRLTSNVRPHNQPMTPIEIAQAVQQLLSDHEAQDRRRRNAAVEVVEAQIKIVTATFDKAAAYTNILIIGAYAGFFGLWQIAEKHLSERQRLWSVLLVFISITTFVAFEVIKMVLVQREIARKATELQSRQAQSDPEGVIRQLNAISTLHERAGLKFMRYWEATMTVTVASGIAGAGIVVWALIAGLAR